MAVTSDKLYSTINEFRKEVNDSISLFRKEVSFTLTKHGEDIAAIKEHLKNQNGRIGKNEEAVEAVTKTANWSKTKLIYITGMAVGISTLLSLAVTTKALGFW